VDSSFNLAVHALVCLSHSGRSLSSEALAENICTNPTRVRRVQAVLKKAGIVETREGRLSGKRWRSEGVAMEQIYDTLPCSTLRVSLETEGNGQSHPFAPWSKCKKRSRRYSLLLRFDPFSKLRHHSTPYCCLNKSATMFCF